MLRIIELQQGLPMRIVTVCAGCLLALVAACGGRVAAQGEAPVWPHRLIAQYPHDATLFTEGLAMLGDRLLESGGRYGQSRLLLREIARGKLLRSTPLGARDFGQGTTLLGH